MAEDDGGTKAQRRAIPTADFGLGARGPLLVRSRVLASDDARFFAQSLDVNSVDNNGNPRVRFGFTLFDNQGDPIQDFVFSHLRGNDGPGVVTSTDLQGLTAEEVVSCPDAPPTIPRLSGQ